jgi:hypothetical protein
MGHSSQHDLHGMSWALVIGMHGPKRGCYVATCPPCSTAETPSRPAQPCMTLKHSGKELTTIGSSKRPGLKVSLGFEIQPRESLASLLACSREADVRLLPGQVPFDFNNCFTNDPPTSPAHVPINGTMSCPVRGGETRVGRGSCLGTVLFLRHPAAAVCRL